MNRLTKTANFAMPPAYSPEDVPRHLMSDEQRAALGRAQIAAGDYIEGDELKAFLDSLTIPDDLD